MSDFQNSFEDGLATPAYGQEQARPGWFKRNWLWFVPTIILIPLFCCCGAPTVLFFIYQDDLLGMVDTYIEPIEIANQHPAVEEALGAPLTPGQPVEETSSDANTLVMLYPISGSKDSGEIRAEFSITNPFEPILISAILTVDGTDQTIDLLQSGSSTAVDTPDEAKTE